MSHHRDPRFFTVRSLLQLAATLLFIAALVAPQSTQAEKGGFRCQEVTFPVTLSPEDATVYDVTGFLCARGTVHNKTIQVVLHGATYSHFYWDFPVQPEMYSYVRRATEAGYAVLNLDRIGIGLSDRPPAEDVTVASNAFVVHQIVQALRGGSLVVRSFGRIRADRVVSVGHSLGSAIAIAESVTYGDVDGVILTGFMHVLGPGVPDLFAALFPANLDPRFAGQEIPEGYLTTAPGTRGGSFFYHAPFFDPAVVAVDEQTKETVTLGELDNVIPVLSLTGEIDVPVLVVVGDHDRLFCPDEGCAASGVLAAEPGFYSPDACPEAVAIPDAGHNLNLHLNAQLSYDVMLEWLDRRIGSDPRRPAPMPCQP